MAKNNPILDSQSLGVRGWRGSPERMPRAHIHTDIEFNFVFHGALHYFFADRFQTIPARKVAVFWAGIPHRLMRTAPKTEMAWVTIPLAWFMQWETDRAFLQKLLRGEMIFDGDSDSRQATLDPMLVDRWVSDLSRNELTQVALLEIEARLRRLAMTSRSIKTSPPDHGDPGPAQRMLRFVVQHYRDDLSVKQVAAAVELHPNYAMQLFKRSCGMSVWEYLTRMRVSHAQRLLLTTDWKISRIALDCGFGSAGRFYENFHTVCHTTPRAYRVSAG